MLTIARDSPPANPFDVLVVFAHPKHEIHRKHETKVIAEYPCSPGVVAF
jgi:hypothetical protein